MAYNILEYIQCIYTIYVMQMYAYTFFLYSRPSLQSNSNQVTVAPLAVSPSKKHVHKEAASGIGKIKKQTHLTPYRHHPCVHKEGVSIDRGRVKTSTLALVVFSNCTKLSVYWAETCTMNQHARNIHVKVVRPIASFLCCNLNSKVVVCCITLFTTSPIHFLHSPRRHNRQWTNTCRENII